MLEDALKLSRHLQANLAPAEALGVVLRLLLARRLELEFKKARGEIEVSSEVLATLPATQREEAIRSQLRDRLPAYPRNEDSFERIARLKEPARGEACLAFLSDFSGSAGERLRDASTLEAIRRLSSSDDLGGVLADLLEARIGPDDHDDRSYEALERRVVADLSSSRFEVAVSEEWGRFKGLPLEDRVSTLSVSTPEISVEVEHVRKVNWAMERNGIPIVQQARVTNRGATTLEGLRLTLQVGPGLSGVFEAELPTLPPGASFQLDRPDLLLEGARLRSVLERERGAIHLELRGPERIFVLESRPVEVLAYNEWDHAALPELLAAFVLPNEPGVARLLETARDLLGEATGDPTLSGYQSRSRERVRAMVDSIHRAIQRLDVTYISPPASFDPGSQKVRFPGDVLEHRMGTCLDLSVLAAAALEATGLNSVLALVRGHVFPGVWLIDDWLPAASTDDPVLLRKLIQAGELLVFDATLATARPPEPLVAAERAASNHLGDPTAFECLLDLRACRLAKIFPLSLGGTDADAAPGATVGEREPRGATAPADEAAGPASRTRAQKLAPERRVQHRRIATWKERLLDLSLRNRLLNFRESRDRTVLLDTPELHLLDDRIVSGEVLSLEPRVELDENDPRVAELLKTRGADYLIRAERLELLKSGRVLTKHTDDDLSHRLVATFRAARTEVEETGSSTLHIAMGMLRWLEVGASGPPRLAPILLYPVELVRPTARARLRMRLRDDEPRLNDTLLEKLRIDFGLEFPELRSLPLDEAGVDVKTVLATLRRGVSRLEGFDVLDEACLSFFSFAKFLMWRDLDQHDDDLLRNETVRHLVASQGAAWSGSANFIEPDRLDQELSPAQSRLVLDADSSQHVAVDAALKGLSFVLQGPPGTGKSQTITNIIAECLAAGKRVLFVAEKRVALDVVARRLKAVGLGEFCLELHSSKANKREIVLELGRALEGATRATSAPSPRVAERVAEMRRSLREYVEVLHGETPLGPSLFRCGARGLELGSAPGVKLSLDDVLSVTRELHESRLEALSQLSAAASDLPTVVGHPFCACDVAEWSALKAREWGAQLRALQQASGQFATEGDRAAQAVGLRGELSVPALESLAGLLELLAENVPEGARTLLSRSDASVAMDRLGECEKLARDRVSSLENIARRFEPRLFELDLSALLAAYRKNAGRFAPWRWLSLRGSAAQLRAAARGPLPGPEEIVQILETAERCRETSHRLEREQPFLLDVLGDSARGAETHLDAISSLTKFAGRWQERWSRAPSELRAALLAPPLLSSEAARDAKDALSRSLDVFRAAFGACVASLSIDTSRAFAGPDTSFLPAQVREQSERWIANLPALRAWARFVSSEARVKVLGLSPLLEPLRSGSLEAADLAPAYERAFLGDWVDHAVDASPILRAFNGRERDRLVEAFQEQDRELIASGGKLVTALLAKSRPQANAAAPSASEVGILQREARKKTRHMSVRRLMEEIPNLLVRLKPCLLMSPLSIAQYLPPGRDPFDLVVFDEASQIPTHDAIGAIARGKQVIVVGDSKQLPPTTFFSVSLDDEDGEPLETGDMVEELESILDECVASHLPSLMLRWHYRSRDERLITFSNWHYYEGKLLTFPAAEAGVEGLGVRLERVSGIFDRARSRTNQIEAEAVVRWVIDALRDPGRRSRSIGIVTFNQPQQTLIEDLLDQARREHPEIEPYFGDRAPEPAFVKNLENVQGDERDVVLFSVTYSPDAEGRVWMNFGALNVEGGERRLNVAITRARLQLVVFSGLESQDIDLSRTRARGVEHLKSFLRYVETGEQAIPGGAVTAVAQAAALSSFELDVERLLIERGHSIERQVGCSGYRIDLAVRDPESRGRYLLGIECDGEAYRNAPTVRDRDRLRQSVLAGLGWRLHRIWSLDWWHDPEAELKRIEEEIVKAIASKSKDSATAGLNIGLKASLEESAPLTIPLTELPGAGAPVVALQDAPLPCEPQRERVVESYSPFPIMQIGTPESFESMQSHASAISLLGQIAEHEGPVHKDTLLRRAAECHGIHRISRGVEERLSRLVVEAVQAGKLRLEGEFAWPRGADITAWSRFRGPSPGGGVREPEQVVPAEIAAALKHVLRISVALSKTDLVRGAAALMGYRRVTHRVRAAFEAAITYLEKGGSCTLEGDLVRDHCA